MSTQASTQLEVKSLDNADETRTPAKANVQIVNVGGHTVMRATFQPGWKWSECIKPVVGTDSCQIGHVVYIISGRMIVVMDDGTKREVGPGCAAVIPPGHDAWIVGDEPCVAIDFTGGAAYAKK